MAAGQRLRAPPAVPDWVSLYLPAAALAWLVQEVVCAGQAQQNGNRRVAAAAAAGALGTWLLERLCEAAAGEGAPAERHGRRRELSVTVEEPVCDGDWVPSPDSERSAAASTRSPGSPTGSGVASPVLEAGTVGEAQLAVAREHVLARRSTYLPSEHLGVPEAHQRRRRSSNQSSLVPGELFPPPRFNSMEFDHTVADTLATRLRRVDSERDAATQGTPGTPAAAGRERISLEIPSGLIGITSADSRSATHRTEATPTVTDLHATLPKDDALIRRRQHMMKVCPNLDNRPLVIVTVGIPGCGKSYTCTRMVRYAQWRGVPAQAFGTKADSAGGLRGELSTTDERRAAEGAVTRLIQWLQREVCSGIARLAVLDAGYNTAAERAEVRRRLTEAGVPPQRIIFHEMRSTDAMLERKNTEFKLLTDYHGVPRATALADLELRRRRVGKLYEPLSDAAEGDATYIVNTNAGGRIATHRIHEVGGTLTLSLVHFILHLQTAAPPIFIAMCGETPDSLREVYGGNAGLNRQGRAYSKRLMEYFRKQRATLLDPALGFRQLQVWTSTARRSYETAEPFLGQEWAHVSRWAALDDINHGEWDGLSKHEITADPHWEELLEERQKDRFFFTYPKGESLHSLVLRMEPVILEIENTAQPLLIIAHREVSWCLLSYLTNQQPHECAYGDVGKHHLLRIDLNRSTQDGLVSEAI
eukprot:TRINITY_DN15201_c0_g1_i1.p1 TRINITY_DN15201_c0_g1~~TRINITY_DN15201_c0_g1_i1.p1  ORF type:complete len:726 (+),score=202.10 TRINITY_DN15201_c0_g1_i1:74-2179(+)